MGKLFLIKTDIIRFKLSKGTVISMKRKKITSKTVSEFAAYLKNKEKSRATIEKYLRDAAYFADFAAGRSVSKELTIEYKAALKNSYAVTSANSMIASLNSLLRFIGLHDCCVKQFRVQRETYCPADKELTKEEYIRLVKTARTQGNERLGLLIETVCGTGIRVSELQFISAEAAKKGEARVMNKGKTRTIFLPAKLQSKLLRYAAKNHISSGPLFITRSGRPMNRCNVWREMKGLCRRADVKPEKVFPHNLRHLFARTFYGIERDIAKLADLLGHSSINTTRIYIITTGAEHRRKLDGMRLII